MDKRFGASYVMLWWEFEKERNHSLQKGCYLTQPNLLLLEFPFGARNMYAQHNFGFVILVLHIEEFSSFNIFVLPFFLGLSPLHLHEGIKAFSITFTLF